MCDFDSLFCNEDGYVVCCKLCGYYQIAYGNTMLNITQSDFQELCITVNEKANEEYPSYSEASKCVLIPTATSGVYLVLTKKEALQFNEILEAADAEEKALSLISMFNQ